MTSAFEHPAIGPEKNGWRDVTIAMGTASIEAYGGDAGHGPHGGPNAGFDVFHPNGVHVGYLRQVYAGDPHGCYVTGLAEPQFIAESTTGDSSVAAGPIAELVATLCEIAGPNPAEDWDE